MYCTKCNMRALKVDIENINKDYPCHNSADFKHQWVSDWKTIVEIQRGKCTNNTPESNYNGIKIRPDNNVIDGTFKLNSNDGDKVPERIIQSEFDQFIKRQYEERRKIYPTYYEHEHIKIDGSDVRRIYSDTNKHAKDTIIDKIELNKIKEEILAKSAVIKKLNEERLQLEKDIADRKADDFLLCTIGITNYKLFHDTGVLPVIGSNGDLYRIVSGKKDIYIIEKVLRKDGSIVEEDERDFMFIKDQDRKPVKDTIASVYANIITDADGFDKRRGCGTIYS